MSQDFFVEISAGKTLFSAGEAGAAMYVIESGLVEIQSIARGAESRTLLGPGDVCGVEFLVDGKPHSGTAVVKESARLLRLNRGDLLDVIRENPEIAIGLLRRLLETEHSRDAVATPATAPVALVRAPAAEKAKPAAPAAEPAKARAAAPAAAPVEARKDVSASPAGIDIAKSPTPTSDARPFALRIVTTGQILPLEAGRSDFLVGRPDPASGMRPEIDLGPFDVNRSLSRRHARIVHHDGVYFVREDNATVNGTYANGERLSTGVEVPLKTGDKLRFGTIEVELVAL